jgi:hypothetical protein
MLNRTLALGTLLVLLAPGCHPVKPHQQNDSAVTQQDAAPPSDAEVVCQHGTRRCQGLRLEICQNNAWELIRVCQDVCDPVEECTSVQPGDELSFIWIADTAEGKLSKVDTKTLVEVGRYWTCPAQSQMCDPSRTAVNLHGDAVVTNRTAMPGSITKFAASKKDCIDRNDNGVIDTSTGPNDVLAWGQDECMIWHTPLPSLPQFPGDNHGARATSWNGTEDPLTGRGGYVYVGTCPNLGAAFNMVFKINGDDGVVEDWTEVPGLGCAYGGAMDGEGGFWMYDFQHMALVRLDLATYAVESHPVSCGYGMTADNVGGVWATGGSCASRIDRATGVETVIQVPSVWSLRGVAIGRGKSDGYAWSADTDGSLVQFDLATLTLVKVYPIEPGCSMVGASVDYEGYVWTVCQSTNKAHKFDLDTETHESVNIGMNPYTYSDMTGMQLRNVIPVE